MQGRPDRERPDPGTRAGLNGTSKLRAISQGTGQYRSISQGTGQHKPISILTSEHKAVVPERPPHMPPRMDSRPEMPRAPRAQYETPQPRKMRRLITALGVIGAIITIFVSVIIFLVVGAIKQSAGPAVTATDFVSSLYTQNYEQAYHDLGRVTLRAGLNLQAFVGEAKALDDRYGKVTDYKEVADSAIVNSDNTESFTYTITRKSPSNPEKLTTYKLTITLQQDPNDNNKWKVISYGPSLGPT